MGSNPTAAFDDSPAQAGLFRFSGGIELASLAWGFKSHRGLGWVRRIRRASSRTASRLALSTSSRRITLDTASSCLLATRAPMRLSGLRRTIRPNPHSPAQAGLFRFSGGIELASLAWGFKSHRGLGWVRRIRRASSRTASRLALSTSSRRITLDTASSCLLATRAPMRLWADVVGSWVLPVNEVDRVARAFRRCAPSGLVAPNGLWPLDVGFRPTSPDLHRDHRFTEPLFDA